MSRFLQILNLGDHWLAVVYVFLPNSITAQNDELVIAGLTVYFTHIWLAADQLLIPGSVLHALVVEIS